MDLRHSPRPYLEILEARTLLSVTAFQSFPGLSRNDQLRLLGNGVVPLQGAAGIRYLFDVVKAESIRSAA